jgi:hypothetical protein
VHGIQSNKEKKRQTNIAQFNQLVQHADPAFKEDPARFYSNLLGLMAAYHALPFTLFKSTFWKLFARHAMPKLPLETIDIRKPIIEQYISMKAKIRAELMVAKKHYLGVPFACFTVDLYRNPYNKQKFAGFRISFIDPFTGDLRSYGLGCLDYNPTLADRKSIRASDLLAKFSRCVIAECGLTEEDILSSSPDSGSDVKRECRFGWALGCWIGCLGLILFLGSLLELELE